MCLYIDQNHIQSQTAEDDIHVWKIISTSNESAYLHFKYTKNTTYKTTMRLELRTMRLESRVPRPAYDGSKTLQWHVVENGFHAYTYKPKKIIQDNTYDSFLVGDVIVLTDVPDKFKIVEFVIPKGATYYTGTLYGIVSDEVTSGSLDPV